MALHSAVAAAQSVRSSAPPSRRGASSDTSSSSESSGILAHRIMFRPPKPGRTKLVQITSESARGTWSIPALSYLSPEGQVLLYPFTRMQLGKVMVVDVDVQPKEVQNIRTAALFEYCARRSDMPKEMVEKLALEMELNGGGPHLDRHRLASWRLRLYDPRGNVSAGVPCPHCHRVNPVRMAEIAGLHNISTGLSCGQLGRSCSREEAPFQVPLDLFPPDSLKKEEFRDAPRSPRRHERYGAVKPTEANVGTERYYFEPQQDRTQPARARPPTSGGIWRNSSPRRLPKEWCRFLRHCWTEPEATHH